MCDRLIFNKCAKAIQWGKNSFPNKWYWINWISIWGGGGRAGIKPQLSPYTKCNLKQIIDFYVKPKIIKLLKDRGEKFHDLGVGEVFSDRKRIETNWKIFQVSATSSKLKTYFLKNIKNTYRQATIWEKIFKVLIPKIYKGLLNLNKNKTINLFSLVGKNIKQTRQKRKYIGPKRHKKMLNVIH